MDTKVPRFLTGWLAGRAARRDEGPAQDPCRCLAAGTDPRARVGFHTEPQDTRARGWLRLLDLVEEAAADGREEFAPLGSLTPGERREIITLPASIGALTRVRHLVLYGSNLVRLPAEIGGMTALEAFTPYTSYRLHWFPYEITRCARLVESTVSTRALFGNTKIQAPFPWLRPSSVPDPEAAPDRPCSVCAGPVDPERAVSAWTSLTVATDVLPLLVRACSEDCLAALPPGAPHHPPGPHRGGPTARPEDRPH
ncbi:leucine-rich repeat domain-containing protein [Streptomyces sp. BI20]|uniref:leucine-rich repeat domain-containing protein n=1 Tax=Streptomyces sp. BI20 TaxID=3403460 RepID=UPI003C722ED0